MNFNNLLIKLRASDKDREFCDFLLKNLSEEEYNAFGVMFSDFLYSKESRVKINKGLRDRIKAKIKNFYLTGELKEFL